MLVWLYGNTEQIGDDGSFWLLGFSSPFFHLQMGTRIVWFFFSILTKYIATSSVWKSYALVALGGVYEEDVCIYWQAFYPAYITRGLFYPVAF